MGAKSCGSCNECCIAPSIASLGKPRWKACTHLQPGCNGCGIYADRPTECQTLKCAWLTSPEMPSRFRPDRCGFLVFGRPGNVLDVFETGSEKFEGSRLHRWMKHDLLTHRVRLVKRDGDPGGQRGGERG